MSNETRDAAIFRLWQRGRNGNTMPRWTYQRIGDRYNLTTHRINQIIPEQKAINKWRKAA
jgi:DNA-directed RNA polymerase sigma subunit (sigma70/sigma32)